MHSDRSKGGFNTAGLTSVAHHLHSVHSVLSFSPGLIKHDGNVSESNKVIHWHIFTYTSITNECANFIEMKGSSLSKGAHMLEDPNTLSALALGMLDGNMWADAAEIRVLDHQVSLH